jgi:hypothetical protein
MPKQVEADMKQRILRQTLTAALLALAAGAAYGQDRETTAEIPFAFRAVGSDLPAGRYRVVQSAGYTSKMTLQNVDTGKSVFINAKTSVTDSKTKSVPAWSSNAAARKVARWPGFGRARGADWSSPRQR